MLEFANLRRYKPWWWRLLLAAGMLMASAANAHLMSAGVGSLQVREHDAVVLIGVPVSAIEGADDDGDGLLQPSEIKAHRTEILAQLASSFHLSVGGQVAVVREALLMTSVHAHDGVSAPQLEWWALLDFSSPVKATDCTRVGLKWFPGTHQAIDDMVYTVQFRHQEHVQTAVFSKAQSHHAFQCAADAAVGPH